MILDKIPDPATDKPFSVPDTGSTLALLGLSLARPWIGAGTVILAPEKVVGGVSEKSPANTQQRPSWSMPRRALCLLPGVTVLGGQDLG